MTYQAIILLNKNTENASPSILTDINDKPFLHYQLNFLSENQFKKIVFVHSGNNNSVEQKFGKRFDFMELVYVEVPESMSQMERIHTAFYHITDLYAFVLNGSNFFRLNLSKADDFRRMRDSRILAIGKILSGTEADKDIFALDSRGQILHINGNITDEESAFFTDTWLISKAFYTKNFSDKQGQLFNYIADNHQQTPLFCMICRQYFIALNKPEDIAKAQHEFAENYFQ